MIDINKKIMEAMKSHDKVASMTYKSVKAKILEFKTAKNAKPYDESAEINLIKKMIDERQNNACIYLDNNRGDLADEEYAQIKVLDALLPPLPTEDDVKEWLIAHYPLGIDKKEMGKVIKEVKCDLVGVDGKMASEMIKSRLV